MASDKGSTTMPWPVTGRMNSAVRRSTRMPWPGLRCVPTSSVPPVLGSAIATVWPGASAAKIITPLAVTGVSGAGRGEAAATTIRHPVGARVSRAA